MNRRQPASSMCLAKDLLGSTKPTKWWVVSVTTRQNHFHTRIYSKRELRPIAKTYPVVQINWIMADHVNITGNVLAKIVVPAESAMAWTQESFVTTTQIATHRCFVLSLKRGHSQTNAKNLSHLINLALAISSVQSRTHVGMPTLKAFWTIHQAVYLFIARKMVSLLVGRGQAAHSQQSTITKLTGSTVKVDWLTPGTQLLLSAFPQTKWPLKENRLRALIDVTRQTTLINVPCHFLIKP